MFFILGTNEFLNNNDGLPLNTILIKDPQLKTQAGIGVGDTKSNVLSIYKDAEVIEMREVVSTYKNGKVIDT